MVHVGMIVPITQSLPAPLATPALFPSSFRPSPPATHSLSYRRLSLLLTRADSIDLICGPYDVHLTLLLESNRIT